MKAKKTVKKKKADYKSLYLDVVVLASGIYQWEHSQREAYSSLTKYFKSKLRENEK